MHAKKQVALTSVIAAVFLTGTKLVVGLATNSLGILSEAAHSGLDLIAALMTLVAVTIADRPADQDHHYGHGKIENLSALLQTMLLFITCGWIVWEAVSRLISKTVEIEASAWGFIVIIASIIIDFSRSRALSRVAKQYNSQALEADALHFSSDIWSSLVVLIGLVCVRFGYIWVDAVAAVSIAILVLVVSYRLARRTIDALMDRVPEKLYAEVQAAVKEVPGVEEVRGIRLRASGPRVFADVTLGISRTVSFQQAHRVMDRVEDRVRSVGNVSDVVVHAEPHESKSETVADKVRMIAVDLGFPEPHGLRVYSVDGTYQIEFHLEHEQGKTLEQAHHLASTIEREIKKKIPDTSRVTIHLEEYHHEEIESMRTLAPASPIRQDIERFVLEDPGVTRCAEIVLLTEGDTLSLSLTCEFDKERTLADVHGAVSALENRLRGRFNNLGRITIHTEPS